MGVEGWGGEAGPGVPSQGGVMTLRNLNARPSVVIANDATLYGVSVNNTSGVAAWFEAFDTLTPVLSTTLPVIAVYVPNNASLSIAAPARGWRFKSVAVFCAATLPHGVVGSANAVVAS